MLNWKLSLFLLLAIILLFIPVSLTLVFIIGPTSKPSTYRPCIIRIYLIFGLDKTRKRSVIIRVFVSLTPVVVYLFLLSWIPLPDPLASSDMTTIALSRLVVLGTIVLGFLSGFGAVSNAWAFFPLFSPNRY